MPTDLSGAPATNAFPSSSTMSKSAASSIVAATDLTRCAMTSAERTTAPPATTAARLPIVPEP